MVSSLGALASGKDARGEIRDEVMHRTRAVTADGKAVKLVIVNISASGLMARCDAEPIVGDGLRVHLPIVGDVDAVVRWALGGRIGCELDETIPLAEYYGMLSTMLRAG